MKLYKTLENGIKIVEYEERYAAGLADMWNRSKESWGGGDDVETEQSQLDFYRSGSYYNVYLALDGDEVIGLCSLARYYKDADALYVHVLNVRPDYMSKKIGKALVLQCLERTIELGFPRLEIHTWPGNTKAVPVYKKCGFMWEDNSETTHLSNFLPTILSQELLRPFFAEADWYGDTTRKVVIEPDGVKSDGFEFFTYEWEKAGQRLAVTVEKSGRRICRVETNDYIVELKAASHALAYGLNYHAEVITVSKSGKLPDVRVSGKEDGAISFDPDKNTFSVGKPVGKQDPYRKHPCVLADVTINGAALEMGVGIEANPPLSASFDAECGLAFPGQRFVSHVTLESALSTQAGVRITLPDNEYIRFAVTEHTVEMAPSGKASFEVQAEVLKPGHAGLELPCRAALPDGQDKEFSIPLDIINQGLCSRFACITEKYYGIINGVFSLEIKKDDNSAALKHALVNNLDAENERCIFLVSKLGKPFDDEFNLAVPKTVNTYESGADIVMELSYESEKHPGVVLTMIYSLSAGGVLSRKHRVESTGDRVLYLSETIFTGLGHNAAYRYDGRLTMSKDAGDDGFGTADPALFEENWAFESNPEYTIGVCWDSKLRPAFRFGDGIVLEHELSLTANNPVETPPVTVCLGVFRDFHAFRDYAMQAYSPYTETAEDLLEITVNGGNPFIYGGEFIVGMRNNRSKKYGGSVTVSPDGDEFFEPQTCKYNENEKSTEFKILPSKAVTGGFGLLGLRTEFPAYLSEKTRAVFFPSGRVECVDEGGTLTVSNGCMKFSADPRHYAGLFSLQDIEGAEWLLSKYPKHEPFEWWNPFIGGIHNWHEKINASNTLKESTAACFIELKDCFGNLWQGIKARVEVGHNDEYNGLCYDTYYLTLPGVPVLCSFSRYANNTGGFLNIRFSEDAFLLPGNPGERIADVFHKGSVRKFALGSGGFSTNKAGFVRMSASGGCKLHWLPNISDRRAWATADSGLRYFGCYRNFNFSLKNGGKESTRPMFYVLSERALSPDALSALTRLTMNDE